MDLVLTAENLVLVGSLLLFLMYITFSAAYERFSYAEQDRNSTIC